MDVPERAPSLWASLNFTPSRYGLRHAYRALRAFARPSLFTAQFRSRYGLPTATRAKRGTGTGNAGGGASYLKGLALRATKCAMAHWSS